VEPDISELATACRKAAIARGWSDAAAFLARESRSQSPETQAWAMSIANALMDRADTLMTEAEREG
jgi:hypothetical protein